MKLQTAGSAIVAGLVALLAAAVLPAHAQNQPPAVAPPALPPVIQLPPAAPTGGWGTAVAPQRPATPPAAAAPQPAATAPAAAPGAGNTTVVPRSTPGADPKSGAAAAAGGGGQVKLVALLTADGQRIDQGLVWRVFQDKANRDDKPKLLATYREANPVLKLTPGDYVINVAFGRAHLTRKVAVKSNAAATEQFVLNAGGMRINALVGKSAAAPNLVTYSILTDERDQFGNRTTVMSGAKPGTIIRLNAGIYHVVSTYGDANATVRADVTVEAGKLTEANVTHTGSRITFKLVPRSGGEALPDTQWSVQTLQGEVVKESVGALPTHILAPGNYRAVARSGGKAFSRDFSVNPTMDAAQVEVVMQ